MKRREIEKKQRMKERNKNEADDERQKRGRERIVMRQGPKQEGQ